MISVKNANNKIKIILGVETSCDDTCVAVIKVDGNNTDILANLVMNQNSLHEKYGGIVPEVAARSHLQELPTLVDEALKQSNITIRDIDLIAYTAKPGLLGSLLVGINFSKGLALANNIPIVEVDHLEAHLLVNFINKQLIFPSVGLIISGGHTELWRFHSLHNKEKLISTKDDAIGEFFDKVGRIMDLPFPAGPWIEKLAKNQTALEIPIPKVLSFSGLKTKFIRLYEERTISKEVICKSMEVVSTNLLVHHISHFINKEERLIVGGGVSANQYIRQQLTEHFQADFVDKKLCTDNGVMIAFTGYLKVYK